MPDASRPRPVRGRERLEGSGRAEYGQARTGTATGGLATSTQKERCPRVERAGDGLFEGEEEAVAHLIERIVAPLGLRVDATSPWVDARLADGSRVQTRFFLRPFVMLIA